jgi:hypothetical protein
MFPYEPLPVQYLDARGIGEKVRSAVGDIRQPWIDLGAQYGISAFAAKALFALGMMRRYTLSANAILKDLRYLGFLSAYVLLGSGVELLGRCIHENVKVRQDPAHESSKRLEAGFKFIKRSHLPAEIIVETNHFRKEDGGYNAQDLINLRHLATHGGCLTKASEIKGDIELLHELRKAFYGIPVEETDPHEGHGPAKGAIDRYYEALASGDAEMCHRLASAGISPIPLELQGGEWAFDAELIGETKQLIHDNLALGHFPISGNHHKTCDYFQLYPESSI